MIDNEQSRIDLAEAILEAQNEPIDLYDLYDEVAKRCEEQPSAEKLNAFFAELTTSAKFVYMGDNSWDLKRRQKIELWEKDGSFFNEYREVEDAVMEERIAQQKARAAAHEKMLEDRERARVLAEQEEAAAEKEVVPRVVQEPEPIDTPDIEAGEEDVVETPDDTPEPIEDEKVQDKAEEDTTDEVDEEYDDFDEDEYNEYMDEFEDKYEK